MNQIPSNVQTIINDYIRLFDEHLPNALEGLYLHGSIALNAYEGESSDIDFIAVTNRRLTEYDFENLSIIHKKIEIKYKSEMDGVYILWDDIGKLHSINSVEHFLFYNDNELSYGPYFNFNPITWFLLKNKGINVLGPMPSTFQYSDKSLDIVSYVKENMNTYWASRITWIENSYEELIKLPSSQIEVEIEWSVLGILRQFYTLKENEIISKINAGEYGLLHTTAESHNIIKEAILIRKGEKKTLFHSNEERIQSFIRFSKNLIEYCNKHFSVRLE
ncbi:aminoglycoside adenylyltransferase domain-containing protein [Bacillus sp. CGMCC 1.16607]|uniref:aminoglycoside adenylyltransferase domain-containing protein n=1 Tax=Bacillus sp. CGMCC 1.16607 TaxID=3351842 RepID=UPI0036271537